MEKSTIQLRSYQQEAVSGVMGALEVDAPPPLLVLATGGGKSYCAAAIARLLVEQGHCVLIVVNYVSLINQFYQSLFNYGFRPMEIGLIWAGNTQKDEFIANALVCLTMQQTLDSRPHLIDVFKPTHVIEDEWHISAFTGTTQYYKHLHRIGMTATPWRLDGGVNLSDYTVIQPLSMHQLIENFKAGGDGLLPYEVAVFNELGDLPTKKGKPEVDYTTRENNLMVDSLGMDFVFQQWQDRASEMPTIAFVPSKKHAAEFAQYFTDRGANSVYVTDQTKLLASKGNSRKATGEFTGIEVEFREDAHQGLQEGNIKVVWAVTTIGIGCDWPVAQCCMLLIRSKSISRLVQFIGRVLRPFKGNQWLPAQTGALVMDFMQNFKDPDIPYPCDIRDWRYLEQAKGRHCFHCDTRNPMRLSHCLNCGEELPRGEKGEFADLGDIEADQVPLEAEILLGEMVTVKGLHENGEGVGAVSTWRKLVKSTYPRSKPSSAYYRYKDRTGEEPPRDDCLVGAIFGPNSGPREFDQYFTWLSSKYEGDAAKVERWLLAEFGDRCGELYEAIQGVAV
jgi:superfamily II DNA or RNA helicase